MKRIRATAFVSVVIGVISFACLILAMLALVDIYHGREPSLLAEWNMVRIGFIVFWIFHVLSILCIVYILKLKSKAA
jgi:hypothetical protein